jgi:translation initiation factor 5A
MTADGDTKDDVKMPEGDLGAKITKLFKEEEKDTRKLDRTPETSPGTFELTLPLVVTIQTAMGEEAAVDAKEGNK